MKPLIDQEHSGDESQGQVELALSIAQPNYPVLSQHLLGTAAEIALQLQYQPATLRSNQPSSAAQVAGLAAQVAQLEVPSFVLLLII